MKRPSGPGPCALAVASIVDPDVISTTFVHVDVETHGELTVGETVVDTNHRGDGAPNLHVALDADEPRFVALLLETFARNVPSARVASPGQDHRSLDDPLDSRRSCAGEHRVRLLRRGS